MCRVVKLKMSGYWVVLENGHPVSNYFNSKLEAQQLADELNKSC